MTKIIIDKLLINKLLIIIDKFGSTSVHSSQPGWFPSELAEFSPLYVSLPSTNSKDITL